MGSKLIVEIFASSVLGGLGSIYGAAIGGVIIGASEILITTVGVDIFGSSVGIYQKGIPLVFMILTLLVLPQGLISLKVRKVVRSIRTLRAFRLLRYLHLRGD